MPARRAICGYSGGGELIKCCLNSSGSSRTPPRNVTCKRFFQLSHQSALLPVQVTVLVAVCVAAVAMLDADSSNPIWLNFCSSRCLCSSRRECRRAVCSSTSGRRFFPALLRSLSPAPPPFNAPEARTGPPSWVSMLNPSAESASMRSAPPFSTLASMVAAKFLGRNTTISPLPEDNCDGPGKRTGREASPDSGVIHAVIVPLPVAARTTFETRVRQMPPPLVSTSIGPETYITRTPPPPASPWTDQCACFSNGDISPVGLQLRGSPDVRGANVPATGPNLGVARNVACLDESSGGIRVQVAIDVEYGDVPALGFNLRDRTGITSVGEVIHSPDTSGGDVSALGHQQCVAADVPGLNIPRAGVHCDRKIRGHVNSELHPELGVPSSNGAEPV